MFRSMTKASRALLLALLSALVPQSSAAPVEHVLHISVDGLSGVLLKDYLKAAPQNFPTFIRLTREAAHTFNARCDYYSSDTMPNHISMWTGRPVLAPFAVPDNVSHGYITNVDLGVSLHKTGNTNIPYKASVFDVVHDHGKKTALLVSKTRLLIADRSYGLSHGASDLVQPNHGRDKIDATAGGDLQGPPITNLVNALVPFLGSDQVANYTFVHLSEPDLTAHTYGWTSPIASNMVMLIDQQLDRVLKAVNSNPKMRDKTAVIIVSDHGGGGTNNISHTTPEDPMNYTIPMFIMAPGVQGGADLHTLFSNRLDPGPARPDYTAKPQPLRNGDTGNIALHFLGLPPIPGSFMTPVFKEKAVTLRAAPAENGQFLLWWSLPVNAARLESAESISRTEWVAVSNSLHTWGDMQLHLFTPSAPQRYFRLRVF